MPTYKDAGVDIEKAESSLKRIKTLIESSHNEKVVKGIGSFGAMYDFGNAGFSHPILVSSTDGVGTKILVAMLAGKHNTIGEDLVNHCVNDIAVTGAIPLFFLDYFATGKLVSEIYEAVLEGVTRGCRNHHMPLIGGETAEMPDMYGDEYDLAGTIVGAVDKNRMISGEYVAAGDVLIGLPSNGLHTNGYSLARKVLFKRYSVDSYIPDLGCTLGEELLRIHRSYLQIIQKSINQFPIHGISHITGGGIYKNTMRLLTDDLDLAVFWDNWERPAIFELIRKEGDVPEEDMRISFNLGIGLIFILPAEKSDEFLAFLRSQGENGVLVGEVIRKE